MVLKDSIFFCDRQRSKRMRSFLFCYNSFSLSCRLLIICEAQKIFLYLTRNNKLSHQFLLSWFGFEIEELPHHHPNTSFPLTIAEIHYYTLLYTIIHYYTLLYTIIHYYTLLYTIIHYYTLLYTIIHYYTLLYTIIHYYIIWWPKAETCMFKIDLGSGFVEALCSLLPWAFPTKKPTMVLLRMAGSCSPVPRYRCDSVRGGRGDDVINGGAIGDSVPRAWLGPAPQRCRLTCARYGRSPFPPQRAPRWHRRFQSTHFERSYLAVRVSS